MCQSSEILLEKVIETAYNTKVIELEEIEKFNLEVDDYEKLIECFRDNQIKIIEPELFTNENVDAPMSNDPINNYLKEIGRIKLLTPEEEKELFIEYNKGSEEARKKIIEANLRLVVMVAKRFVPAVNETVLEFLDLIQDGNMGLITAVERFDVEKGYKFSTYATWWIRQSINKNIAEKKHTIRVSYNMYELSRKINLICQNYEKKYGKTPTIKEYSEELGISEQRIIDVLQSQNKTVNFETPVSENGETTMEDFVQDEIDVSKEVENKMYMDGIFKVMSDVLTLKEYRILELRMGLNGNDVHSLKEVGEQMNITRERVRQIESVALKKIKQRIEYNDILFKRKIDSKFKK